MPGSTASTKTSSIDGTKWTLVTDLALSTVRRYSGHGGRPRGRSPSEHPPVAARKAPHRDVEGEQGLSSTESPASIG